MNEMHPGRHKDAPEQVGPLMVARQVFFFPLKIRDYFILCTCNIIIFIVFVFKAAVMCVSPLQVLLGITSS